MPGQTRHAVGVDRALERSASWCRHRRDTANTSPFDRPTAQGPTARTSPAEGTSASGTTTACSEVPGSSSFVAMADCAAAGGGSHAGAPALLRSGLVGDLFGILGDGTPVERYVLRSDTLEVAVLTYGGILQSVSAPDSGGDRADVVLGFAGPTSTVERAPTSARSSAGTRTGSPAGGSSSTGTTYELPVNNGPNTLHGGPDGFASGCGRRGAVRRSLRLALTSPDGDQGFPARLRVTVTYTPGRRRLGIDYAATNEEADGGPSTVVNLTNHGYWNLAGDGIRLGRGARSGSRGRYLPVDATSIPWVRPPVEGLRSTSGRRGADRRAGRAADGAAEHASGVRPQLRAGRRQGGAPVDGGSFAAVVREPGTGRVLEVLTDQPGVQLYSGNKLTGTLRGKGGRLYRQGDALCLETQHWPDSPNHPDYPSTVLRPGDTFRTSTVFRLTASSAPASRRARPARREPRRRNGDPPDRGGSVLVRTGSGAPLAACRRGLPRCWPCWPRAGRPRSSASSAGSAAVPGGAAQAASGSPSGTAPKPALDQDFPDPDVLQAGGTYYAYATQRHGPGNVQLATSTDLATWSVATTDPLPELPAWATPGRTWAPDVSAVPGGGYVMYFAAHSVSPDLQCIGVARATSPDGPVRPVGDKPLVCPADEGGAIDPASFVDADGTRYLLWKNDGNCCGKDTWLSIAEGVGRRSAHHRAAGEAGQAGPAVGGEPRRGARPRQARLDLHAAATRRTTTGRSTRPGTRRRRSSQARTRSPRSRC